MTALAGGGGAPPLTSLNLTESQKDMALRAGLGVGPAPLSPPAAFPRKRETDRNAGKLALRANSMSGLALLHKELALLPSAARFRGSAKPTGSQKNLHFVQNSQWVRPSSPGRSARLRGGHASCPAPRVSAETRNRPDRWRTCTSCKFRNGSGPPPPDVLPAFAAGTPPRSTPRFRGSAKLTALQGELALRANFAMGPALLPLTFCPPSRRARLLGAPRVSAETFCKRM